MNKLKEPHHSLTRIPKAIEMKNHRNESAGFVVKMEFELERLSLERYGEDDWLRMVGKDSFHRFYNKPFLFW